MQATFRFAVPAVMGQYTSMPSDPCRLLPGPAEENVSRQLDRTRIRGQQGSGRAAILQVRRH